MLSEGFKVSQIRRELPAIPKSTIYEWAKEFRKITEASNPPQPKPPKKSAEEFRKELGIPEKSIEEFRKDLGRVDPETPLDKICNALWDIVENPSREKAAIAVQALNALIKLEQWRSSIPASSEDDEIEVLPPDVEVVGYAEDSAET